MKAMRIVYVFAALCGGLALGYSPSNAAAAEATYTCAPCYIFPDGSMICESCWREGAY